MSSPSKTASHSFALAAKLAPATFVCLWATGFIGAKLGLPYVEPLTFLALRFALVVAIMAPAAVLLGAVWPKLSTTGHVAVVGLLIHGGYLGGVFVAISLGMSAGLSALIVSLQPLLTAALVGPLLGERVTRRQIAGLVLGLAGVALVLSGKLAPSDSGTLFSGFGLDAVVCALVALFSITVGVVYQKRFCAEVDLRAGAVVQYAAAGLAIGALALIFETNRVVWHLDLVIALGWLVLVLSVGAVSLLMMLIRLGEASRVASLFYLVPPVTALVAFFLFDERLGPLALAGMVVAVLGVALVVTERKS
ncbi:DMT family transporter [Algihabitans albus]|uniref:DMT family transporter n=1 Tax=Algihabitans albus TaxID=2164067 RepID=UPI000E5CAC8E|nr:DMT family transporter [Algihabitans albus]